jgi:hypothetical protein
MDFGAGQVQRRCDHGNCRLRHVAECLLQGVQDHQRRAFEVGVLSDDLGAARGIPWFVNRRHPRAFA